MKKIFLFLVVACLGFADIPTSSKVYVPQNDTFIGKRMVLQLQNAGFTNIVTKTEQELDLLDPDAVNAFFASEAIDYVFLPTRELQEDYPEPWGDFFNNWILENMAIESNVINAAAQNGVTKMIYLAFPYVNPSGIPQSASQLPVFGDAMASINQSSRVGQANSILIGQTWNAGSPLFFISCNPSYLYGPEDDFNILTSDSIATLVSGIVAARDASAPSVTFLGDGTLEREFLHIDDFCNAALFLMNNYDDEQDIPVGYGAEFTVQAYGDIVQSESGYAGTVIWDSSYPNWVVVPVKDSQEINDLGWTPSIDPTTGIDGTITWYESQ